MHGKTKNIFIIGKGAYNTSICTTQIYPGSHNRKVIVEVSCFFHSCI